MCLRLPSPGCRAQVWADSDLPCWMGGAPCPHLAGATRLSCLWVEAAVAAALAEVELVGHTMAETVKAAFSIIPGTSLSPSAVKAGHL